MPRNQICTNSNCGRRAAVRAHSGNRVTSALVDRCDLYDCSRLCPYCSERYVPEAIDLHIEADSGFGYGCRTATFYARDAEYRQNFLAAVENGTPILAETVLADYSVKFPEFSRRSQWVFPARLKYPPQADLATHGHRRRANPQMDRARRDICAAWNERPNASHKEITEILDQRGAPNPYDEPTWADAASKHENSVKVLISKNRPRSTTS